MPDWNLNCIRIPQDSPDRNGNPEWAGTESGAFCNKKNKVLVIFISNSN